MSETARRPSLPAPSVPFPVSPMHAMRPDLRRLEGPVVVLDALAPAYQAAKLQRLRRVPGRCLALAEPPAHDLDTALAAVLDRLADDGAAHPGSVPAVARTAAGWRLAVPGVVLAREDWRVRDDPPALADTSSIDFLEALPPRLRAIHALGLALQDDWALMRLDAQGAARAELLHVCFPSGWDPASKAGLDFLSIHAPVADGEAVRTASRALGATIVQRGPFERHVWTLADGASLARHPAEATAFSAPSLEDLYFRCERQVTVPLPSLGRALFLIRVHVAPLLAVADDADRRSRLAQALGSMTPAVVAYKGLDAARALVTSRW